MREKPEPILKSASAAILRQVLTTLQGGKINQIAVSSFLYVTLADHHLIVEIEITAGIGHIAGHLDFPVRHVGVVTGGRSSAA